MKPEWKDAPDWAMFACKDYLGDWWWFENEPVWIIGIGWKHDGRSMMASHLPGYKEARP